MADDPTEETIRKEIADAVKILRDDGIHIHRTYSKFQKTLDPKPHPPEGAPPPARDPKPDPPKATKKGIWWGDRNDD